MQHEEDLQKIQFVKKQFLCNVAVKEICWQNFRNLNVIIQDEIINNTVREETVIKYPVNINYQKSFLKTLLQYLEKQSSVVSDSVYEEYARLVALPNNNINFKHYLLEDACKNIILKEDICLITDGTTGLRTWQASLALSEWILANISHFTSKIIIELGSGIGLTGLVLSLGCKPKAVYLSDCHSSVLTVLCDNICLNLGTDDNKNCGNDEQILLKGNAEYCNVHVLNLPWDDVSTEFCQKLGHVDLIVAADVVYDKSIFKALISAVDFLFKYCGVKEFLLSCTERNEETLADFLFLISKTYSILDIGVPPQGSFLWPTVPPVKIFSITRLQNKTEDHQNE